MNSKKLQTFDLETFVPYRLSLLSNTVSEGISAAYRPGYGLSVTEWRVVAILGRYPGLTATDIMQRAAMDKVAVSRAVRKLQQKGMVERAAPEADRRRIPLALTRKSGWELFKSVVPRAMDYERKLLNAFDPEELEQFGALMAKLQQAAEDLNAPPAN